MKKWEITLYVYLSSMIKPEEIRKGIYIYEKVSPGKCAPDELIPLRLSEDILEVLFAARNYEDLEPIPISPEILKSCGFIYNSEEMGDSLAEEYLYNDFCWSVGLKEIYFKNIPLPHIEYLHQLQNLYFILVGEELEIKLPALSA